VGRFLAEVQLWINRADHLLSISCGGAIMDQPGRPLAAEEAFRQAEALHMQGKLKQAEKLYCAILSGDAGQLGWTPKMRQ
jgi:hypothetical protein